MDDLGYSDVGYYGGDIPTPNIDSLANNGIRLNYHYSENVCSATRSALLTGRYAWKTKNDDVIGFPSFQGTDTSFKLISDVLSDDGYDTLFVGKWHLGQSSNDAIPSGKGFKNSLYYTRGSLDYYEHDTCDAWPFIITLLNTDEVNITDILPILSQASPQGFCAYDVWQSDHQTFIDQDQSQYVEDIFAGRIAEYLAEQNENSNRHKKRRRQHKNKNNGDSPFFIYWAMATPHSPIQSPPETTTECTGLIGQTRQTQCNMLYYADKLIGDVIDDLKNRNLYENTLIIWLSDNGAQPSFPVPGFESAGQPLPFRGTKINTFEGGIRVPAVIGGGYLENVYKTKKTDSSSISFDYNNMVYVADFYAIIAGILNIDVDPDIDGIDILGNIENECGFRSKNRKSTKADVKREEMISFRMNSSAIDGVYRAVVMTEEYKLLVNPSLSGSIIQFDFLENWINYDATVYLEPNETYYRLYSEFDENNYDQGLFFSQCYEDYLEDPIANQINVEPYYKNGDETGDKLYLFDRNDNIEACNIAADNEEIVDELLQRLEDEKANYRGGGGIFSEKGPYLAVIDSYDCEYEEFFYVVFDGEEYLPENVDETWTQILMSYVNQINSCN